MWIQFQTCFVALCCYFHKFIIILKKCSLNSAISTVTLYKTWQTKPIPLQSNSVGATVLSVKHEHAEWVHYLILVILCVENGHQKSSSFTWCGVLIKHASLNNLCKKKTTQNTRSNSISIPFLMLLYRLINSNNNRIMPKDRCFLNIFFVHGKKKYLRIPKAARSNFIVHCPANWPAVNSVECKMMCWFKTDLFINIKLISCGSKDLLFNTVHCHEPQNTNFVLLANTMSTILSLEILEQENSRKVQIYSLRILDGREANKKIGQIC